MFRGTVGARGLFGVTCAFLLLAGCGTTDPGEPQTPGPTISIEPTETPLTSPPKLPEAAKGTDETAAIAFAKHYIDVLSYAAVTGDTAYLRTLSSSECIECLKYPELYETVYKDGGYFKRDPWQVTNIEPTELSNKFEIVTTIETSPSQWRMKAEEPEQTTGREIYQIALVISNKPKLTIVDMFNVEHE